MEPYVITRRCVDVCDTGCVEVCPVDCIAGPYPTEEMKGGKRKGLQLYIDPDECIGCGACAPECPADAIFELADVPPRYSEDVALNAAFFDRT